MSLVTRVWVVGGFDHEGVRVSWPRVKILEGTGDQNDFIFEEKNNNMSTTTDLSERPGGVVQQNKPHAPMKMAPFPFPDGQPYCCSCLFYSTIDRPPPLLPPDARYGFVGHALQQERVPRPLFLSLQAAIDQEGKQAIKTTRAVRQRKEL